MPKVSVIIVSFNSAEFIKKCIESVSKFIDSRDEIIVIDNASTDNTVSILKSLKERINLIESKVNLGFSKANNLAAKKALSDFLLFLNPDAFFSSGSLDQAIKFYETTNLAGLLGFKLIMPNGEIQPSVKKFPTFWRAFKEFIIGINNEYSQYVPKTDQPIKVETVYGAAILIKKDLFLSLGGFNEKYFMYYEDIDLCRKISEAKKGVFYYPGVVFKHLVGGTKSEEDRNKLNTNSFFIYHGFVAGFAIYFIFLTFRILNKIRGILLK